ncbi:glycosyltransferase, MGT family [Saccharopolyspora antimicrobica]|uniref:Glycosyltransferase, MGT family n=1 Tax=Saccharopolyspora antimicrobica TaxID=455193 RepID=A0A1I4RGN9_9PSEU|nr:glycosyltransferase [Saccharopolyspora antimicrobica]RKT88024.1 MGT family glycosyltransferase [Saccharopolyspora antimicrobica]SFM51206.1 glycosyltransferase, MGT family [Saccharopolyspora antimicrobica]
MRILFTCIGGPGHLNPLLPISRAVADAGHTVLWAASDALGGLVENAGFSFHRLGSRPAPGPRKRAPLRVADAEQSDEEVRENFARRATRARLPLVGPLMRDWKPDLVVCDEFDFATMLTAERLDVPHVSVLVSATGLQIRPDVVGEPLQEIRAECGLPADPDLGMLGRHLRLSPFPPTFRAPGAWRHGTERALRPLLPGPAGPPPDWARARPHSPVIYFTLGTEFGMESGDLYERVLDGLREMPVNLLMTVGRQIDPAEFGPQPEHVRIAQYVNQDEVLPHCDAVVSHGGSGSVMGALAHGLPSLLVPIGADQPMNAERGKELGVALVLDALTATPVDARAAVSELLAAPTYRQAAERLRAELAALPGPDHAAALLEEVGRAR